MSGSNTSSFSERRLERAVKHVSDYWFPVNPTLMAQIRTGLSQGSYESDLDILVSEIRSDFSLFTYCLKHLAQMLKEEGKGISYPLNPVQLLKDAGLERLKEILSIEGNAVSAHGMESASNVQAARFKEVMISASSAEVLADKYDVDSETAYSAALLRQLGYTLIAWNYPSIYEEAIGSLTEKDSLEMVLAKHLGFSPQSLAMRLLHSWGISAEACNSIGVSDGDDEERIILTAIGETISRLCKVGEALARANDPEHYPSAKKDWSEAKQEIEAKLGPTGLNKIQDRFEDRCEYYTAIIPHMFKAALISEPSFVPLEDGGEKRNPYFARCTPEVQRELRRLYRSFSPESSTHDNVRRFVKNVVPTAGFSGGAVFTLDPGLMMLVPQLEIKNIKLRNFEAVDYSVVVAKSDVVAVAYQITEPVVEYKEDSEGELISGVAGLLGSSQRVGVLYLEIPSGISPHPDSKPMLHFNALRFALNDCLGLR